MNRFLKGFGIFLLLAVLGIASAFGVIAYLLRQEEVRVPDLTGQDIVSALDTATQLGLQLKVDRREPSQAIAKDSIVSQTPQAGSTTKKGRQLKVVVSLGPSELLAPKLTGENFRKAEVMIRQAGFFPGTTARAPSESVERDTVIAQSPDAGAPLEKDGKISLLVSSGKEPKLYVMPKLTGKRADVAIRTIESIGLLYRTSYRSGEKTAATERVVLAQKPLPGYPVGVDATVELVLSK